MRRKSGPSHGESTDSVVHVDHDIHCRPDPQLLPPAKTLLKAGVIFREVRPCIFCPAPLRSSPSPLAVPTTAPDQPASPTRHRPQPGEAHCPGPDVSVKIFVTAIAVANGGSAHERRWPALHGSGALQVPCSGPAQLSRIFASPPPSSCATGSPARCTMASKSLRLSEAGSSRHRVPSERSPQRCGARDSGLRLQTAT